NAGGFRVVLPFEALGMLAARQAAKCFMMCIIAKRIVARISRSPKSFFVCGILGLLSGGSAPAVQTSDYAVQVSATSQASPPQITLSWPQDSSGAPLSYIVSRKLRDATFWDAGVSLPGTTTTYTDSNVTVGGAYEYQVKKVGLGYAGFGYVYAGIGVPAVESRGKVLLIVD